MNFDNFDRKTLWLFGGLLALCILLLFLAFFLLWQPSSESETQQPNGRAPQSQGFFSSLFSSRLEIASFSPPKETILPSGQTSTFIITFNKAIRLDSLSIALEETLIQTDTTTSIGLTHSLSSSDKVLTLTTKTNTKPYATYLLTIAEKSSRKVFFSQTYSSAELAPTPLPVNNAELQQYLPYETGTYALSYLESQNIYIFNFLFNPDDPTDIQTQFDQAKQNALLFIQSKGIDPDSVTIDWRYH